MAKITAVVADSVVHTGTIDFTFLWYASSETYRHPWGLLELLDSKWHLSMRGLSRGIDFMADGSTLGEILRDTINESGDFSILTTAIVFPFLQAACQGIGVELVVHPVPKQLSTSGNQQPSDG